MPHALPLHHFDQEMTSTRHLLERVPFEKADWKPHPKSFSLAHLAQLVASMPGWITLTLRQPELELGGGQYTNEKTEELLASFDKAVKEAREALETITDDATLQEPWSLKSGGHAVMTLPRGEVVIQNLCHLSHHRGQLTVYLRMLDVPLPEIYGPTADSKPWGAEPPKA